MIFRFLTAIFTRRACVSCGKRVAEGPLCKFCSASVEIRRTLLCAACGMRLFGGKIFCHPDMPYLLGAACDYKNPALRSLVHALKFRGIRRAAEPLAAFLIEHACSLGTLLEGGFVVPIPLSRRRERERGFNQAGLIARRFARELSLPFSPDVLLRIRHTKPQSETADIAERRKNLRDCFALKKETSVRDKKIILIDDVTTSGATFLEAAKVLASGGARTIYALAAARA